MKIREFQTKTPRKPVNKTYIIGNGQVERELRAELEAYTEEVRLAREELANYEEFMLEYDRRGKLLVDAQKEAGKVPGLVEEISNLRSALMDMSKVLREDNEQTTAETADE